MILPYISHWSTKVSSIELQLSHEGSVVYFQKRKSVSSIIWDALAVVVFIQLKSMFFITRLLGSFFETLPLDIGPGFDAQGLHINSVYATVFASDEGETKSQQGYKGTNYPHSPVLEL